MKQINYYKKLGLTSSDEIFEHLINTLKDSIYTWGYFTDFEKSISNTEKYKKELNQINDLLNEDEINIEQKLLQIVNNNYKTKEALLLLLALRKDKLKDVSIVEDFETLDSRNKYSLFTSKVDLTKDEEKDLLKFFEESGLKKFFVNKEVNSLLDYCKGVEVGMDTHARKSRTGESMETICETYIKKLCDKYGYSYIRQATAVKIKAEFGRTIHLDKINRRFDFAINTPNNCYLVEVNYYSVGGSKLKATAGEYKELSDMLSTQGLGFIWFTDGKGWNTAKTALRETFEHNDYIFNLDMIGDGVLEEVIK